MLQILPHLSQDGPDSQDIAEDPTFSMDEPFPSVAHMPQVLRDRVLGHLFDHDAQTLVALLVAEGTGVSAKRACKAAGKAKGMQGMASEPGLLAHGQRLRKLSAFIFDSESGVACLRALKD